MPEPTPAYATKSFDDVLTQELLDVQARRQTTQPGIKHDTPTGQTPREKALNADLVGVALSGGGIRSATFALGVIQGLASLRLLRYVDYLSSVSGGGYVASWLAAWIKRDGNVRNVEKQLSPSRVDQAAADRPALDRADWRGAEPEPAPVAHLRNYGSYLTPWRGLFTADTWTLLAIYFRNLLINLCILVPAAAFLVLVPRWAVWFYGQAGWTPPDGGGAMGTAHDLGSWLLGLVMAAGCGVALWPRPMGQAGQQNNRADLFLSAALLMGCLASMALLLTGCAATGGWVTCSQELGAAAAVAALVVVWWLAAKLVRLTQAARPMTWFVVRVLIPVLFAAAFAWWFQSQTGARTAWQNYGALLATGCLFFALFVSSRSLVAGPRPDETCRPWYDRLWPGLLFPLLVVALLVGWVFGIDPSQPGPDPAAKLVRHPGAEAVHKFLAGIKPDSELPIVLIYVLPVALLGLVTGTFWGAQRWGLFTRQTVRFCFANLLASVVGGLGLYLILHELVWQYGERPRLLATFVAPLIIVLIGAIGYAHVAVAGRIFDEQEREWRSRIGGYLLMFACGWLAFFIVSLFLPGAVRALHPAVKGTAVLAWLATTFAGAIASRYAEIAGFVGRFRGLLVRVAPVVFLAGLLAVVSYTVDSIILAASPGAPVKAGMPVDAGSLGLDREDVDALPEDWQQLLLDYLSEQGTPVPFAVTAMVWLTFGSFAVTAILMGVIDVNLFSLHALYANRLTRCYLGASRIRQAATWPGAPINATPAVPRREDPVTGMDPADDLPLADLRIGAATPADKRPRAENPYFGPLLLVNTALNVVGGEDLALRDRKGISFTLSAHHCGSPQTGYAVTPNDGDDVPWNFTLGRAMAVSGAAVDPNMSFYQSPQLTAFLTVLNARLGYWIENPRRPTGEETWKAIGPAYGSFLLSELLGQTDDDSEFVHLSDGGHFENTGAYELIRRRCRYVILCDAGEDVNDASENLANLIRTCRIDFGIRIEIDTTPLRQGDNGLSRWHCAIGQIRYDDVDRNAVAGILVFMRVSLTGDEPADVRQYAKQYPDFPHQSTLDQFFDEAQLESYRALGQHVASEVFAEAAAWLARPPVNWTYRQRVRGFFARLRNRWFPPPPDFSGQYVEVTRQAIQLLGQIREDPDLKPLREGLYPEAKQAARAAPHVISTTGETAVRVQVRVGAEPGPAGDQLKELFMVNEMLGLMEMAWLGVNLDGYYAHPLNRGWMDAMHRWTSSPAFQRHWPLLRAEFGKDFVRFCERALAVQPIPAKAVRAQGPLSADLEAAARSLSEAFGLECAPRVLAALHHPAEPAPPLAPGEYLFNWITDLIPAGLAQPVDLPLWFVTLGQPGTEASIQPSWEAKDYPVGLVLVRDLKRSNVKTHRRQYELLVWIRGAHRSLGLGRDVLQLKALSEAITQAFPDADLVARYPLAGSGSGDRLQRALWMSFFHDYNFRQLQPPAPDATVIELVLEPGT